MDAKSLGVVCLVTVYLFITRTALLSTGVTVAQGLSPFNGIALRDGPQITLDF